jgi:hypothetical protein
VETEASKNSAEEGDNQEAYVIMNVDWDINIQNTPNSIKIH